MRSRSVTLLTWTGLLVAAAAPATLAIAACGDLKSAGDASGPSDGDADASTVGAADASDAADAAGRGPGPHGSLPSGYCCNADTECRYRRCADTGAGGKMCLDDCYQQIFCKRPDITFTCVAQDGGGPGVCRPPGGFACIPASEFVRGTDPIGACCNASDPSTADGTSAAHCEGNQCASVGSAPLVCIHRCEFAQDCPGGYQCIPFGGSKACVPTSSSYTCK
jgi:hypothetical protein